MEFTQDEIAILVNLYPLCSQAIHKSVYDYYTPTILTRDHRLYALVELAEETYGISLDIADHTKDSLTTLLKQQAVEPKLTAAILHEYSSRNALLSARAKAYNLLNKISNYVESTANELRENAINGKHE